MELASLEFLEGWGEGRQARGISSSCVMQGWVKLVPSLEKVSLKVMGMGAVGGRNLVPA